jgi:hypothetical protein
VTERFRFDNVGEEDPSDESQMSGFGWLALWDSRVEYHFSLEDMSVEEAETYVHEVLNRLPDEALDAICDKACEWKNEKMSSDTAVYPEGLAEAEGRRILDFMSVGDVKLYRNPYDRGDHVFGATLGGGTEWDLENGMEIVIRGNQVLEVREFLGYDEFAAWDEPNEDEPE